jgi:hypothetical protein
MPLFRGRDAVVTTVRIYSSETMGWVARRSGWNYHVSYSGEHAYLNGFLHLGTTDTENGIVAAVDTEGQAWTATRVCPEPPATLSSPGVIGQSQRRLLYADAGSGYARELSPVGIRSRGLRRRRAVGLEAPREVAGSVWKGVVWEAAQLGHSNVVFLSDSRRRNLIAYDMDRGTSRVVHTWTVASSGKHRFFPYIPSSYLQ